MLHSGVLISLSRRWARAREIAIIPDMKRLLPICLALAVGIAAGYFMRGGNADTPERQRTEPRRAAKGKIADGGDSASLKALQKRVAELEKLLAKSGSAISNAVAEVARIAPEGRDRRNPRAWMENLRRMKTEDPERYAQTTNRIASWRRSRAERARSTMEFLSSIDVSHMDAKAQDTHNALQDLIVRREALDAELQREDLPDSRREEIFRELRETHGEMMRLNGEERGNLIRETARGLGFGDEDSAAIADTIQEVIRATDGGFGGGRRGGPRGAPPPSPGQ